MAIDKVAEANSSSLQWNNHMKIERISQKYLKDNHFDKISKITRYNL